MVEWLVAGPVGEAVTVKKYTRTAAERKAAQLTREHWARQLRATAEPREGQWVVAIYAGQTLIAYW